MQTFFKTVFSSFFVISISACSHGEKSSSYREVLVGARVQLSPDDSRVGSYVSSWKGFRTSSYWIEGPTGLIAVDTQFLPTASEQFLNWAEKTTGKKFVLAIILHPNPDKFNGTSVFQKRGVRVITSQQVLDKIPEVHRLRKSWFFDRFKPDYPVDQPTPESFGDKNTEIQAAGLNLKLHVMGSGCSEAHVVVQFENHVFVGDLVTIGFHSWLELGHLNNWLKRLDEIQKLKPEVVHTGRGGSGDHEAIDRQIEYLETVKDLIKIQKNKKRKWSEALGEQLLESIVEKYPAYDYEGFVETGLKPTWDQL